MSTLQNQTSFFPAAALVAPMRPTPRRAPQSLFEAVQAVVVKYGVDDRSGGGDVGAGPAFQPQFMLCMLTYCYARQIYSSSAIQRFLSRDAIFRRACGDCYPDRGRISRFRHEHIAALQFCLTAALKFLARRWADAGNVTHYHESFLADEARRRLIMAACTDSLEVEFPNGQELLEETMTAV